VDSIHRYERKDTIYAQQHFSYCAQECVEETKNNEKANNESESTGTKNSWVSTYVTGGSVTGVNKNNQIMLKLE